MKREDVIKLAVDAGFTLHTPIEHIGKFKRLIELATKKAVEEEREACAMVCEQHRFKSIGLAEAIRSRKS